MCSKWNMGFRGFGVQGRGALERCCCLQGGFALASTPYCWSQEAVQRQQGAARFTLPACLPLKYETAPAWQKQHCPDLP